MSGPNDACIFIEGPSAGDAAFYGLWLLAAAEAEVYWKQIQQDRAFDPLRIGAIPDLGIGAVQFICNIKVNSGIVDVRPTQDMVEVAIMVEFVILAELGLFTPTGDRYQFTLPDQEPTLKQVREIALKLALTEDEERPVYPERYIITMPRWQAERWQERLSVINESHRCADRNVLLGIDDRGTRQP